MDQGTAIERTGPVPNVGEAERWVSGITGGMLVLRGITKRSLSGVALAFVGGWLLDRGLTGHSPVYRKLGIDTTAAALEEGERAADRRSTPAGAGARPAERGDYDEVDEASDESFPASDSPSWTPDTHIGGPPHGERASGSERETSDRDPSDDGEERG